MSITYVSTIGGLDEVGPIVRPVLAARLVGVSRQYVERLVSEGRFRRVYVLGELFLIQSEVSAWAAGRKGRLV